MCAAGAEKQLAVEAKERERQRKEGNQNGKRSSKPKATMANLPESIKPNPTARDEAAAMFGASPRYVQHAKAVIAASPDLSQQVTNGEISLNKATEIIKSNGAPGRDKKAPGKRSASKRTPRPGASDSVLPPNNCLVQTIEKLKALGKVSRKRFLANIGRPEAQAWFQAIIAEQGRLPVLEIVEGDGMMELVVGRIDTKTPEGKAAADLRALVIEKIAKGQGPLDDHDQFKFDACIIKKYMRELYEAVSGGTVLATTAEE
jgi:hypothetical protein